MPWMLRVYFVGSLPHISHAALGEKLTEPGVPVQLIPYLGVGVSHLVAVRQYIGDGRCAFRSRRGTLHTGVDPLDSNDGSSQ